MSRGPGHHVCETVHLRVQRDPHHHFREVVSGVAAVVRSQVVLVAPKADILDGCVQLTRTGNARRQWAAIASLDGDWRQFVVESTLPASISEISLSTT